MPPARLVTPTLLNQMKWFLECPPNWKDKAHKDLMNKLNRVPFESNEAMDKGSKFEQQVQDVCYGERLKDEKMPTVDEVAEICKDGRWQQRTKCIITIDGQEYLLFGYIDVLKADRIIDIKTTGKYKGPEYYRSSFQHTFYLYSSAMSYNPRGLFEYVVSDFERVHRIPIKYEDKDLLRLEVHEAVTNWLRFIKDRPELEDAYVNKYCWK